LVDPHRHSPEPVRIEKAVVLAPCGGYFAWWNICNLQWNTTVAWIHDGIKIGTHRDGGPLTIGRDPGIHAGSFGRDRSRLSSVRILHIDAWSMARLLAKECDPLVIEKPLCGKTKKRIVR